MITGGPGWPASGVLALVALVAMAAGYLTARLVHIGVERRRGQAARSAWRSRLRKTEAAARRLDHEARCLAEELLEREYELAALRARLTETATGDREQLAQLREQVERDRRIATERARLLRVAATFEDQTRVALREALQLARLERSRQRASLSALQAALAHAKRAQANMEERLTSLREQVRRQQRERRAAGWPHRTDVPHSASSVAPERAIERIVEIPVDRIVYRDREVPVEVPIEVPVGFTTVRSSPGTDGLKPTYSENRPSST